MLNEDDQIRINSIYINVDTADSEDIYWLIGKIYDLEEELEEVTFERDKLKGEA